MRTRISAARRRAAATLIGIVVTATTMIAHHGWIEYDKSQILTISGTITEARYSNPHAWIRMQTASNQSQTWRVILAPPSRMRSRGLPQEMLESGITVSVVGNPHRHHADEMRAERITIGDKTIGLR